MPSGVIVMSVNLITNTALTDRFPVIVTLTDGESPKASPSQHIKTDPALGVAVRVTNAPVAKIAVQVLPQLMPTGFEIIVPEPDPVVGLSIRQKMDNCGHEV